MWSWLASILGDKDVNLTFDNSKNVEGDLSISHQKDTDKSKQNTKTNTSNKTKNIYRGPVVHSAGNGNVNVFEGDLNLDINIKVDANGNLTPATLQALAPLTDMFENKQVNFITQGDNETVTEIFSFEDNPDIRGLLKFFRHRLKTNDFLRMQIGLYLKYLGETGKSEQAGTYWRQVTKGQRQRDRRIIELASAGYFDTFFRPFYKLLIKANAEAAAKRFNKELEAILEDMRFAIFISSGKSVDNIVDTVMKKAIRNIKYGSTTEVISLHAAGAAQVNRVKKSVPMLRETFPVLEVITVPRNVPIIRVDISYRKNNIDEDLLQDDLLATLSK